MRDEECCGPSEATSIVLVDTPQDRTGSLIQRLNRTLLRVRDIVVKTRGCHPASSSFRSSISMSDKHFAPEMPTR